MMRNWRQESHLPVPSQCGLMSHKTCPAILISQRRRRPSCDQRVCEWVGFPLAFADGRPAWRCGSCWSSIPRRTIRPQGPPGAAGNAGSDGSPDTPAQVLAKLATDGANSGLDSDRLDGISSNQFMRSDGDTGTTGSLNVGNGVTVQAAGRPIMGVDAEDRSSSHRCQQQRWPNQPRWCCQLSALGTAKRKGKAPNHRASSVDRRAAPKGPSEFVRAGNGGPVVSVSGTSANTIDSRHSRGRPPVNENGLLNQARWDLYRKC